MDPRTMILKFKTLVWVFLFLSFFSSSVSAFGAGNIGSLSKAEGSNWRHGDIEDMLKTVACLHGHKWTSMMIRRVYFGNWLRDYSQAVDVGALKHVPAGTIRLLVWILGFMCFGYSTAEFEVTEERLGTYRPEEHIDNPKDYADNEDAREYDNRLRGPLQRVELDIDPETGMKNYIANETGEWDTSAGYVKYSLSRSIKHGRKYTSGSRKGNKEDLYEALRCLGQALHCLEDFGAHSNYVELALREMGFNNIFPHTGTATEIDLHGKRVFPLITGTFGGVDFIHSLLGEATDHVAQSELEGMNETFSLATSSNAMPGSSSIDGLVDLLSKIPGMMKYIQEARKLQHSAQEYDSSSQKSCSRGDNINTDALVAQIYPILEFRDNLMRAIEAIISGIPGLEKLIDVVTESITMFVFSLLAPYIQPVIAATAQQLKNGSQLLVQAAASHQYEPWTDSHCTDPTHSLLSKDHFSNILNQPAGLVATTILKYVTPLVIHAWEQPDVSVERLLDNVCLVFHHPAIRDSKPKICQDMFNTVSKWVENLPDRGASLNEVLSSVSVKAGRNHTGHTHGLGAQLPHDGSNSTVQQSMYADNPISHDDSTESATYDVHSDPLFAPVDPSTSPTRPSGSPFNMSVMKGALSDYDNTNASPAAHEQWHDQGQYTMGEIVSFNGTSYKCLQTHHVDAPNWTPDIVLSLWAKCEDIGRKDFLASDNSPSNSNEWHYQGQYQVGDVVEYNGIQYKCLQTHHVDAPNWTPDITASLWTKL